jgi:hypothetical protein
MTARSITRADTECPTDQPRSLSVYPWIPAAHPCFPFQIDNPAPSFVIVIVIVTVSLEKLASVFDVIAVLLRCFVERLSSPDLHFLGTGAFRSLAFRIFQANIPIEPLGRTESLDPFARHQFSNIVLQSKCRFLFAQAIADLPSAQREISYDRNRPRIGILVQMQ